MVQNLVDECEVALAAVAHDVDDWNGGLGYSDDHMVLTSTGQGNDDVQEGVAEVVP